ncbi:MAG: AAA family ATPase [Chitinophagaceae bacterium]
MNKIRVTNFKLFSKDNNQDIAIAPITFIIGKNNAGKSSFIESLTFLSHIHELCTGVNYQTNNFQEANITRLINELFYRGIQYANVFNTQGNFYQIKNNTSDSDLISFELKTSSTNTKIEYKIGTPQYLFLNCINISVNEIESIEFKNVKFYSYQENSEGFLTRVMKLNTNKYFNLLANTSKEQLVEYVTLYKEYLLEFNADYLSQAELNKVEESTIKKIPLDLHVLCEFLASKEEQFQTVIQKVSYAYNLIDKIFLEMFSKRVPNLISPNADDLENCRVAFELTTTWHDYWDSEEFDGIRSREKVPTFFGYGFSFLYRKSHRYFFMQNPETSVVNFIFPNSFKQETWNSYLTEWGKLFLEFIAYDLNKQVIPATIVRPFVNLYFTKVTNRRFQDYSKSKSGITNELTNDVSLLLGDKETTRLSNILKVHSENRLNPFDSDEQKDIKARPYKLFQNFIASLDEWDDIILSQNFDTLDYYVYIEKKNGDVIYINNEGYGTNQVVPILIKIAAAVVRNKKEMIIIEEPELSLHPAAQSQLLEFLCNIYLSTGIRFMLETHSEYMIRKTQYLIASTNSHLKNSDCIIHSFSKDTTTNTTEVKSIEFKENGELSAELASGFLDEANKISLSILALQRSQNN